MRVAVVGLGGVGGYIAAKLAKASIDVTGIARGEHLARIKNDGIKIIEDENSWGIKIKTELDNNVIFDYILFCVKSYDLRGSFDLISPYIGEDTKLLSFANGVGNGDILRAISNNVTVLDGCVYILSHIESPGSIRKKGKVFASVFGGDEKATLELRSLFEKAELRVKTPDEIKTAIWKKYIFISAYATITSYYNQTIGYVVEHHFDEVKLLLNEIANVAKASGVNIEEEVDKSLDTGKNLPYDATTSMYLDFKNKKRDELEGLSGYIVQEGKKYLVDTPVMTRMYDELLTRHIA